MKSTLSLAVLSLFAPLFATNPCSAQQTRITPPYFANTTGYSPRFVFEERRFQQLIEGDIICKQAALLNEITFRRGSFTAQNYGALNLGVELRVGHSKRSTESLSLDFASNWAGTPQTVYRGQLSIPANQYLGRQAVHPFNIALKFTRPFLYRRDGGSFLFELLPGKVPPTWFYALDGSHLMVPGAATVYGTGGQFATSETHWLYSMGHYRAGRETLVQVSELRNNYPTVLLFGASSTSFGSLKLPFDLAPLGAPGNHLYVSIDGVAPVPLRRTGNTWTGFLLVPIPPEPRLANQRFYMQAASLDRGANALGLVWSRGLEIKLAPHWYVESVGSYDPTATRGFYHGNSQWGLIVRLGGLVFN